MKIPAKEHAKLLVEDDVWFMLDKALGVKKVKVSGSIWHDCRFNLTDMKPVWLMYGRDDDTDKDGNIYFHPKDVDTPDLVWPLTNGTLSHRKEQSWGTLQFDNVISIDKKTARKHAQRVGKYNALIRVVNVSNGTFLPCTIPVCFIGSKWIFARNHALGSGVDVDSIMRMHISMNLTHRYVWGAQFSLDGSLPVIVPSSPAGILELFNDRDKSSNEVNRRSPLRHWVNQHLRKKADSYTNVVSHLRGNLSFKWRGFDVVIKPAQFDIDRAGTTQ